MSDDLYPLHASLGYQLSLTARLVERQFEEQLRGIGLTRITWCILLAAGAEELSQPSEIAQFVGIDRTATSRALRQMEASGLIGRKSGTGDRRTTQVAITEEGVSLMDRGSVFARENAARFEAKLSNADRNSLKSLLSGLRAGEAGDLTHL